MREIKFRVWNIREKKMYKPFHGCSTTYNLNYYENATHVEYPMQYTGIKDKNGIEIYENDIIKTKNCNPFRIVFHDAAFMGAMLRQDRVKIVRYSLIRQNDLEVIGNIHENKELLETP